VDKITLNDSDVPSDWFPASNVGEGFGPPMGMNLPTRDGENPGALPKTLRILLQETPVHQNRNLNAADVIASMRDPQSPMELREYIFAIYRHLAESQSLCDFAAAWRKGYDLALRFGAADEAKELRPPDADGEPANAAYFAAFTVDGVSQVREKLARLVAWCNRHDGTVSPVLKAAVESLVEVICDTLNNPDTRQMMAISQIEPAKLDGPTLLTLGIAYLPNTPAQPLPNPGPTERLIWAFCRVRDLLAMQTAGTQALSSYWQELLACPLYDVQPTPTHRRDGRYRAEVQPVRVNLLRSLCQTVGASLPAAITPNAPAAGAVQMLETPARLPAFASASDLAVYCGLGGNQVETFLRRYREKFPDCYREAEGGRVNEPKYLYRTADVLPELQKKVSRKRRQPTDK
jgi:hypothetical protein